MSKQMRQKSVLPFRARNFANLGAANTGTIDSDQDLPALKCWNFHVVQDERRPQLLKDRCLHLHREVFCRLFEIDEFVIAGVPEVLIEPNPFRAVEKGFAGKRPALKIKKLCLI